MRAIHRDGRIVGEPEAPGPLGRHRDPNPWPGRNFPRSFDRIIPLGQPSFGTGGGASTRTSIQPGRAEPEWRASDADVRAVQRPVDVQRLAQPGRPPGQVTPGERGLAGYSRGRGLLVLRAGGPAVRTPGPS